MHNQNCHEWKQDHFNTIRVCTRTHIFLFAFVYLEVVHLSEGLVGVETVLDVDCACVLVATLPALIGPQSLQILLCILQLGWQGAMPNNSSQLTVISLLIHTPLKQEKTKNCLMYTEYSVHITVV